MRKPDVLTPETCQTVLDVVANNYVNDGCTIEAQTPGQVILTRKARPLHRILGRTTERLVLTVDKFGRVRKGWPRVSATHVDATLG